MRSTDVPHHNLVSMALGGKGGGGTVEKHTKKDPVIHLMAGGIAGIVESSCCHPLDTIKTQVQLSSGPAVRVLDRTASGGVMGVAMEIVQNGGFFELYRGLSAVMAGIVPKMAVRFSSFEAYKGWLGGESGSDRGECTRR